MKDQRRPLTGSDAAGAVARVRGVTAMVAPLLVEFFIGFLVGIAVVVKRFRHL